MKRLTQRQRYNIMILDHIFKFYTPRQLITIVNNIDSGSENIFEDVKQFVRGNFLTDEAEIQEFLVSLGITHTDFAGGITEHYTLMLMSRIYDYYSMTK